MRGALLLASFVKNLNLTQAAFARRYGFSPPLLNMWLRGQRIPGRRNAHRLADITAGAVPVESWDRPVLSRHRKNGSSLASG